MGASTYIRIYAKIEKFTHVIISIGSSMPDRKQTDTVIEALNEYRTALRKSLPDQFPGGVANIVLDFVMNECINVVIVSIVAPPPRWNVCKNLDQWWIDFHPSEISVGTNILVPGAVGGSRLSFFWINDSLQFLDLMVTGKFAQALWNSDEPYLHNSKIPRSKIDQLAEEITATFVTKMREATVRLS
jgi:hypothetical protein